MERMRTRAYVIENPVLYFQAANIMFEFRSVVSVLLDFRQQLHIFVFKLMEFVVRVAVHIHKEVQTVVHPGVHRVILIEGNLKATRDVELVQTVS